MRLLVPLLCLLGSVVAAAEPAPGLPASPAWPEEAGPADPLEVERLKDALDRASASEPRSARAAEARYRKALLELEPGAGYDLTGAREDLAAVARTSWPEWVSRASHTLAWIHERDGQLERAREAYVRVVVDHPNTPGAARAMAGLGRVALASGEPASAAAWLEQALASGVEPARAVASREAAVRVLLQPDGPATGPARSLAIEGIEIDEVVAIVVDAAGAHLATRRPGDVVLLGADGEVRDRWSWDGPVSALASDGWGRTYAAAGESLWRLAPEGKRFEVARLGELAPPGALAVGAASLWIADKRGQRIVRVDPGASEPTLVSEDRQARIVALAWDGRRLVGVDLRSETIRELWNADEGAVLRSSPLPEGLRPEALSSDASGRLLLTDARAGTVRLLDREGGTVAEHGAPVLGIERLAAAALGTDGSLHVIDARALRWLSWP